MATLKITQIKSRIGATATQCKNLDALGLRKINQTVQHSDSAIIKGMVERVKHLVTVEVVEVKEKKAAKKAAPAVEAPVVEAPAAEAVVEEKPAKKAPAKKEAAEKKPAAKKVTKTKKEE